MTFFTGLNCSRFTWLFNRVKSNTKILHKKLSLEDHMLVVLMKIKLGLLNKDLPVRFDTSTSRMLKIFRSLVPLIAAHMTYLCGQIMGQLGSIYSVVLKRILKIVCASQIAMKHLLKDLKTLQQEHRHGQIISIIILQSI